MENLNQFYLATDPFDKDAHSLIIRLTHPKCIIEVFYENNISKVNALESVHQCFFHIDSSGHSENWVFVLRDTFNIYDRPYDEWKPIIKEAWEWFNEYLHLTNQLSKENEESKLN